MSHRSGGVTRRHLLQASALGAAAAMGPPALLRAQGAAVKLGVLHPVSGALSYSGQQGRLGATLAIEDVNAAGGIKALGGAKIEAVLGDADVDQVRQIVAGGGLARGEADRAGIAADDRRDSR